MQVDSMFMRWFKREEPIVIKSSIRSKKQVEYSRYELPTEFKVGKDTIVVVEDNVAQVSAMHDDVTRFQEAGVLGDVNILLLTGKMAVFDLKDVLDKYGELLQVKWAILDVTIGGTRKVGEDTIRYDGVDAAIMVSKCCIGAKHVFLTGNSLTPEATGTIADIVAKYKGHFKKEIFSKVITKSTLSAIVKRGKIANLLFGTSLNEED